MRTLLTNISDILLGEEVQPELTETSEDQTIAEKEDVDDETKDNTLTAAGNKLADLEEDAVPGDIEATTEQEGDIAPVFEDEEETKESDFVKDSSNDQQNQESETHVPSRDSNSRHSFKCRGCGVESNKAKFEDRANEYDFERDENQRSMSDTFTRRKKPKAATIDSTQVCN